MRETRNVSERVTESICVIEIERERDGGQRERESEGVEDIYRGDRGKGRERYGGQIDKERGRERKGDRERER